MRPLRTVLLGTSLAAGLGLSGLALAQQRVGDSASTKTDAKSPALDPMIAARGARHLLRNGLDYLQYQEYEKALTYLRGAEAKRQELGADEVLKLTQGIEQARRGLREPNRGRVPVAARAPVKRGLGDPFAEAEPIQLTGATATQDRAQRASGPPELPELPPSANGPRPEPTRRASAYLPKRAPREAPAPAQPAPVPAAPPVLSEPPPLEEAPTVVAPTPRNVSGTSEAPQAPVPTPMPERPTPTPAPLPELGPETEPSEPPAAPPPLSEASTPGRGAAQPPIAPLTEVPEGLPDVPPASPAPPVRTEPAPTRAPEPAPVRTAQARPTMPSRTPPPGFEFPPLPTTPSADANPAPAPPVAPAPLSEPAPAPRVASVPGPAAVLASPSSPPPAQAPPARPAEEVELPPIPPRVQAAPARSAANVELPPLPPTGTSMLRRAPEPTPGVTDPSSAFLNPPTASRGAPGRGLPPDVLAEIALIEKQQEEDLRRYGPAGPPRGDVSPSETSSRLVPPRPPSPTEARPIKAIPTPDDAPTLGQREWSPTRKYWAAAATCHGPLYFQDAALERYGQSVEQALGPIGKYFSYPVDDPRQSNQRRQILQPFASIGLFAFQIAYWPINAVLDPPTEPEYDLGYYRPGDRIPPDTIYLPVTGIGPPLRGSHYP